MRLTKLLLLSCFLPVIGFAQITIGGSSKFELQNPETPTGSVLYNFSYIADTTHPELVQKEVMRLDFTTGLSNFSSETFHITDSLASADIKKQLAEQEGQANINIRSTVQREGTADIFMHQVEPLGTYEIKKLGNKMYLLTDNKPAIDWEIEDSTKLIGDYTCQKAVGTSKGRQYIAWFTTDLPYNYGPRRLSGLPGLILEAYDITHRIVYEFKQYLPGGAGQQVGLPKDAIVASQKEFADMQEAFKVNPQAFFSSNSAAAPAAPDNGSSRTMIKSISIVSGKPSGNATKKVINFPIELTQD